MEQYHELLKRVLTTGDTQFNERTESLMIVSAGDQSRYHLREGFPVVTTKSSAPLRWVGEEMFWMLRGERSAKTLDAKGVDIWNANAFQHALKRQGRDGEVRKHTSQWNDEFKSYVERMRSDPEFTDADADLGPVYGWQWRHWQKPAKISADDIQSTLVDGLDAGLDSAVIAKSVYDLTQGGEVDQVARIVEGLKAQPGSRYHIMSAWNVGELGEMAIGPCHSMAQFTVVNDRDLDLNMFQRSCDVYLGVPFNVMQYALLNELMAKETGLEARDFVHSYGNVHIYGGVGERANFLRGNLSELVKKVDGVTDRAEFKAIRDWYVGAAPPESEGNERKDHVPFILEQLSKKPYALPELEILQNRPFFELIEQPAKKVARLNGYKSHKWDSKAVMAV